MHGHLLISLGTMIALASGAAMADPGDRLLAQPSFCATPFSNCRAEIVTNNLLERGCLHSDPGGQMMIEPGYVPDANGNCVRVGGDRSAADTQKAESHVDWDGKS